jgi:hypothetical protein
VSADATDSAGCSTSTNSPHSDTRCDSGQRRVGCAGARPRTVTGGGTIRSAQRETNLRPRSETNLDQLDANRVSGTHSPPISASVPPSGERPSGSGSQAPRPAALARLHPCATDTLTGNLSSEPPQPRHASEPMPRFKLRAPQLWLSQKGKTRQALPLSACARRRARGFAKRCKKFRAGRRFPRRRTFDAGISSSAAAPQEAGPLSEELDVFWSRVEQFRQLGFNEAEASALAASGADLGQAPSASERLPAAPSAPDPVVVRTG